MDNQKNYRRFKGDGSVYQRQSDGRWVGKYKDEYMPRAKYVYAQTENEARKKLIAMRKEMTRGLGGDKRVLFNDYFERWLFHYKKNVIKPTSLDKYEEIYRAFIKPYFNQRQLYGITSREIQGILDESIESTSYSRAEKIYSLLKMCFEHASVMGDIQPAKNPMLYVKLPEKALYRPERSIVVLQDDQIKRFEEAAFQKTASGTLVYRYAPLLIFLLNTGLRRGELLALKWSDIDFEKRIVKIRRNLYKVRVFGENYTGESKYVFTEGLPKTKSGIRDVPLNQKAIDALLCYKENCEKCGSLHEYIARTSGDQPLAPAAFSHVIKRVLQCSSIDVERYSLHCFRHTFATRLIRAGVELKQVSEWLGHSSSRTTIEVYQHLMEDEKRAAVALLETL